MANVYSIEMIDLDASHSNGVYYSAVVPAGFVWDVRNINAMNIAPLNNHMNGFFVFKSNSNVRIWGIAPYEAIPGRAYGWEGRCVLSAGDKVGVQLTDNGFWSVSVAGFQLTLP